MSPASGDYFGMKVSEDGILKSFHSINVPSEWGRGDKQSRKVEVIGFHSINVPSEWGRFLPIPRRTRQKMEVSIQLMSPASGDKKQSPIVDKSL